MVDIKEEQVMELVNHQSDTLRKVAELVRPYSTTEIFIPPIEIINGHVQSLQVRAIVREGRIKVEVVSRATPDMPDDFVLLGANDSHIFELGGA